MFAEKKWLKVVWGLSHGRLDEASLCVTSSNSTSPCVRIRMEMDCISLLILQYYLFFIGLRKDISLHPGFGKLAIYFSMCVNPDE